MPTPIKVVVKPEAYAPGPAEGNPESTHWRRLLKNNIGLINRNIYYLRVSRQDFRQSVRSDNLLLFGGSEVSQRLGLLAEPLDRVHHVLLLIQESDPHVGSPGEVVVHHLQHIGIVRQGLHACAPRLSIDPVRVASIAQVTVREHDLGRHGGGRQNLRDERVRVQRNRAKHVVQIRWRTQLDRPFGLLAPGSPEPDREDEHEQARRDGPFHFQRQYTRSLATSPGKAYPGFPHRS